MTFPFFFFFKQVAQQNPQQPTQHKKATRRTRRAGYKGNSQHCVQTSPTKIILVLSQHQ
eukprot:TRINITY_DN45301_c0_g1_i1.p3 TRINITY_DN45301_c0_g1~~TRINITY_DN45301_c0_g1_i1.p3  ORF type:complete len:59 (-),score=6.84 TRINITY_DN45301_c0_g1_i1:132-308(-)